ncbi:MAG: pyrroloquinoline quinone-dependent dehydrogenase [Bryobacterales bacterium]|nr:pyrroloquinoline quinone-dependent dehydrogenase [Bryobacterales bacterium]
MEHWDRRTLLTGGAAAALAALLPAPLRAAESRGDWAYYGGDEGATRYSPLDRIRRNNVGNLKVAWVHRAGDASPRTTMECTPVVADGVMYLTTAMVQARALNAATGEPIWNFNPAPDSRRAPGVNRGVTYFEDGRDRRIYTAIRDKLYALNARNGEPVRSFGDNGIVDLTAAFDHDMAGLDFRSSSPPVVFEDTVIVGGGGGEGPRPAAPGHVRGYDVYTGKRKWIFHTIPRPGQFGYDTWNKDSWKRNGGTNNWAGMTIDRKRGWVFVSTGCAAFDFWGGDRIGDNLFSDCVLALDARTGKRVWHYQTVHHDVWDYDLPAQPALLTIRHGGRSRDVVAQVTKTGMLFLLDRETGKPLFDVEERKVPASEVEGEMLSPTQPFPVKPAPFSRQIVNEDLVTDISPEARAFALKRLRQLEGGVPYPAPSLRGTIFSPGTLGGALWGGCAFDPASNLLFVNSSELPSIITLVPGKEGDPFKFSHTGYEKFVDHEDYPAVKPPWGHMTAIDLATGEHAWREILGEYPKLVARGKKNTGTFQLGGAIATAGGLVFVAATADEKIRALDTQSGKTLWEHKLPHGGYATPCTYEANGKQYVVIACGGGNRQRTPAGDEFVAFTVG